MNETGLRIVEAWVGKEALRFWKRVTHRIEKDYPKRFPPEWRYGGKKHGWSLRYKKGRSFCTLLPEKNRFAILIIYGADERGKVERIRDELSQRAQTDYDRATSYHDGKWLLLAVDRNETGKDVQILQSVKRRAPKAAKMRC